MTTPDLGKLVPYDPAQHEGFVLQTWVGAWARPRYPNVNIGKYSDDERAQLSKERKSIFMGVWDKYRDLALRLTRTELIKILVDTEDENIVWGWIATSPDESVVHEVVLKYKLTARHEHALRATARKAVRSMVGHLADKKIGRTGELRSLKALGMLPANWYYDTVYFAGAQQ